jgi:hypothetical protein
MGGGVQLSYRGQSRGGCLKRRHYMNEGFYERISARQGLSGYRTAYDYDRTWHRRIPQSDLEKKE